MYQQSEGFEIYHLGLFADGKSKKDIIDLLGLELLKLILVSVCCCHEVERLQSFPLRDLSALLVEPYTDLCYREEDSQEA
jgi:hypothetical protein